MFGHLKYLVFRGAAGSVSAPPPTTQANDAPKPYLRPEDRWMTRTKRKRDIPHETNDKHDGRVQIDQALQRPGSETNHEPVPKKARTDDPVSRILTPVSDLSISIKDSIGEDEPSLKRARSSSVESDDTSKRSRQNHDGKARPHGYVQLDGANADEDFRATTDAGSSPAVLEDQLEGEYDYAALSVDAAATPGVEGTTDMTTGLANIARLHNGHSGSSGTTSRSLVGGHATVDTGRLHRRATRYLAERQQHTFVAAADEGKDDDDDDDDDNYEEFLGVDCWPGSAIVPGSLPQEPQKVKDDVALVSQRRWLLVHDEPSRAKRRRPWMLGVALPPLSEASK